MKRYSTLILGLLIAVTPTGVFGANEDTGNTEVLKEHVAALERHVDRLLFDVQVQHGTVLVEPLSEDTLSTIISDSVSWLKEAQEKHGDSAGHFRYEYHPYTGTYSNDDNIVRQAGTFYQVGEVARLTDNATHDLEETLVRSADFFLSLSREGSYNDRTFRCVVRHERSDDCKLGATSLVLVGLLDLVEAYPEHTERYEALMHDYASFIMAMRNEGAGFRNRFYLDQELQSSSESSFSNGEAMLALARYYRFNEEEPIRTTLTEMFAYISSDAVAFDSPLYLWAMAALRDMHELWPEDAYLSYAKTYTDWRVGSFQYRKLTDHNMCAYVEGVASAYVLLKDHLSEPERASLEKEINFWLAKMQQLQVGADERFRVFKEEDGTLSIKRLADPERARGGFLTGHNEPTQRIDYTQHCLNAYLLYDKIND